MSVNVDVVDREILVLVGGGGYDAYKDPKSEHLQDLL